MTGKLSLIISTERLQNGNFWKNATNGNCRQKLLFIVQSANSNVSACSQKEEATIWEIISNNGHKVYMIVFNYNSQKRNSCVTVVCDREYFTWNIYVRQELKAYVDDTPTERFRGTKCGILDHASLVCILLHVITVPLHTTWSYTFCHNYRHVIVLIGVFC